MPGISRPPLESKLGGPAEGLVTCVPLVVATGPSVPCGRGWRLVTTGSLGQAGIGWGRSINDDARKLQTPAGVTLGNLSGEPANLISDVHHLVQERFVGTVVGVFDGARHVQHGKPGPPAVLLPAQHPTHALHHLAAGVARPGDHRQVGGGNVDTLVEHPAAPRSPAARRAESAPMPTAGPARQLADVEDQRQITGGWGRRWRPRASSTPD
jgi:hypothetical protein